MRRVRNLPRWGRLSSGACIAAASCVLLLSGHAAAQSAATQKESAADWQSNAPRKSGEATLRWFGMRVYDALLWVRDVPATDRTGSSADAPFDREFALELRYAMSLSGARIAERSDQEMVRQPDRASAAQRERWLAQMKALFPDVRDGDRIVGHYRPGEASRFTLNGKPIGEVADPAFGRAFFGIWLDLRTSEPAMREALMAGLAVQRSASNDGGKGGR